MKIINNRLFRQDESGSLAMIVSLVLLLFFGVLLMVNDSNKMQTGYLHLQETADSAVLETAGWIAKARKNLPKASLGAYPSKWLPTTAELNKHAADYVQMAYEKEQSYSKVIMDSVETESKVSELGTDVSLSVCADIETNINGAIGDSKTKKVCVKAVARIWPKALSNKEIVIAYDTNASTAGWNTQYSLLSALVGSNDAFPGVMAPGHTFYAEGVLPTYIQSEEQMKKNNLYVGLVPYTKHVNLYPFSKNLIKDYRDKTSVEYNFNGGAKGDRASLSFTGTDEPEIIRDLTQDYPVFDDAGFNQLISQPAGQVSNYLFDSMYTYMGYERGAGGQRGKIFQDHPELNIDYDLQPYTNGSSMQAYYPNPRRGVGYNGNSEYLGPYGDYTPWLLFRAYEFMGVRRAAVDLYENNLIQPLTNSYSSIKTLLKMQQPMPYGAQFEWAYSSNVPEFKSYIDNAYPNDFRSKYFDPDLWMTGNSARSNGFVGLMTGWTMLSDSFRGKWIGSSVYEGINGVSVDRTTLPQSKSTSSTDKVLIVLMNGFTDDPGSGSMDIVMDNYVQYPDNISYNQDYGGTELLAQTMFDVVDHPNNAYDSYQNYKNSSSASYKKLCDKIKSDGIELYVINYSACYAGKSACLDGFAGVHMKECAGDSSYIPSNLDSLSEDLEGVFEGMLGSERISLIK